MASEKRIKDFEPASDIELDDWFAIDSPSAGTRKVQLAQMLETIQTQVTAIADELGVLDGEVDTHDTSISNLQTKVGTATLTTEAPDLSGAVNELNSRLPSDDSWIRMSGTTYYCIYNGIVFVKVTNQALTAKTTLDIGTLPEEYRPSLRVDMSLIGGSYREYSGVLYTSTDGVVHAYADTSANYWGMLTFPLVSAP